MTKHEAAKLACQIEREAPSCRVVATRVQGGAYSLDVLDTVSGIPLVVRSAEAWEERRAAALEPEI